MFKITKRVAVIAAASVVAAGGAGVAYAEWLANGTGHSNVTAASVAPLVVTVEFADGTVLFPQKDPTKTVPVKVTIDNRNNPDFPVVVESVTKDRITVDPGHVATCDPNLLHFVPPTTLPTIAKGASQEVTAGVYLDKDAPVGCMSADFTVSVSATAHVGDS